MVTLKTSNNEEFDIAWIGVATIDGVLRFSVINSDIKRVFDVFSNPESCAKLTRVYDGIEEIFEGYTVFRGVQIQYDNSVLVSLSKI